ncbi:phage tail tube protein [Cryobacterium sp. AP23]
MSNNASNAIVGKPAVSGGILVAPVGTELPTDESTPPDALFVSVGYLGDSGFSRQEKPDAETKRAWGGDPLITIVKSTEFTAKFTLAEYLNALTQALIYGDENVTFTAATAEAGNKLAIIGKSAPSPHKAWIIEVFSGDAKGRIEFPDAQIGERDDVEYKDDDIAARGVTITLFPDAEGNYFYEYWDDGRKVLAEA